MADGQCGLLGNAKVDIQRLVTMALSPSPSRGMTRANSLSDINTDLYNDIVSCLICKSSPSKSATLPSIRSSGRDVKSQNNSPPRKLYPISPKPVRKSTFRLAAVSAFSSFFLYASMKSHTLNGSFPLALTNESSRVDLRTGFGDIGYNFLGGLLF